MKVYEGQLNSKDLKLGIVIGRFNEFIGSKLLEGAIDAIKRHGGEKRKYKLCGFQALLKFLWRQKMAQMGI